MVLSVGSFDHVDKQIDSGSPESLDGLAHRGQCSRGKSVSLLRISAPTSA